MPEEVDFLVIGAGVAGLYAALELARHGRVLVCCKGQKEECATYQAQGGIAAALGQGDAPALHLEDTMRAGAGLCREEAVRVLAEEGPERIHNLLSLGVPFDRAGSGLAFTLEAAHSRNRILHAGGDSTGREIWKVLLEKVLESPGLALKEHFFALDLLVGPDGCRGALFLDERNGGRVTVRARAVLLAGGGAGQMYALTSNPPSATGDGVAMAYRAGADVADLEFIQFHPTVLRHPKGDGFLISEAVRGEGATLLDRRGRRFMERYHPLAELAPRDIVARGVFHRMQEEGSAFVYLDATALGEEKLQKRFPTIYATCLRLGLDMARDPLPVAPAAHYLMGGVVTDLWGATTVPGLYACGEAACTGVHGANRLASNSLLEGLVFGFRGALACAAYQSGQANWLPLGGEEAPGEAGGDQTEQLEQLKSLMERDVGIVRTAQGLRRAQEELGRMLVKLGTPLARRAMELKNLAQLASLVAKAALQREESRGAHFRADFPVTRRSWGHRLVFNLKSQKGVEARC